MNLDDLKYSKGNGKRSEKSVRKIVESVRTSAAIVERPMPDIYLPDGYSKPEGEIDTRILFILSGGEDRERNYFKMLRVDHLLARIKVAFASKKRQGLTPTQLLDVASRYVKNKIFDAEDASYHFEQDNGDPIYILQDIDEFEPEIRKIASIEQPDCLQWIYSNPAFEMWLFYHHFNTPLPKLKDAIEMTAKERSQWLKHHLDSLIKGGIQTTKAITQMHNAVENSMSYYQEENGLPCLFSTQMHILAKDILDTMGNEFDEMIERKKAFNKAMMEKYRKPIV